MQTEKAIKDKAEADAKAKAAQLAKDHPIPAPPWTAEALGWEKYVALAKAYQMADPQKGVYEPSLDLTPYYDAQQGKKAEPFKVTMDDKE